MPFTESKFETDINGGNKEHCEFFTNSVHFNLCEVQVY